MLKLSKLLLPSVCLALLSPNIASSLTVPELTLTKMLYGPGNVTGTGNVMYSDGPEGTIKAFVQPEQVTDILAKADGRSNMLYEFENTGTETIVLDPGALSVAFDVNVKVPATYDGVTEIPYSFGTAIYRLGFNHQVRNSEGTEFSGMGGINEDIEMFFYQTEQEDGSFVGEDFARGEYLAQGGLNWGGITTFAGSYSSEELTLEPGDFLSAYMQLWAITNIGVAEAAGGGGVFPEDFTNDIYVDSLSTSQFSMVVPDTLTVLSTVDNVSLDFLTFEPTGSVAAVPLPAGFGFLLMSTLALGLPGMKRKLRAA